MLKCAQKFNEVRVAEELCRISSKCLNRFTHLKEISGTVPVVLIVSSSSFSVVHHSVVAALRECLSLVLVCGKIVGLCADAGVGILSLVELVVLWLMAPRLRQRLSLMSVELNTQSLIRVLIRRVAVVVAFILI